MNILQPLGKANPFDYVRKLLKLIIRDRIPAKAASLAYTTILALVPIMTMSISFLSRDLVEGPVKDFVTTTIFPTSQDYIFDQLTAFAENSRKLGTWGLIITIIVVFLLINKINIEVNELLRARPHRNILTRISIYFITIVVSTLTIGSSFSLTNDLVDLMTLELPRAFSTFQTIFSSLGSIILMTMTIILLIKLVSSAHIKWSSALVGALVGAMAFELTKKGFSFWATYSIRNSVIYGSLFMFPILFIWINLAWIIVLSSLEIAYLHQHPNYLLFLEENRKSPSLQAVVTMELYLAVEEDFLAKRKPPQLEDLTALTGMPEIEVLSLLDRLLKYVLIIKTDQKGYVPATDPDKISREDLIHAALDEDSTDCCLTDSRGKEIWKGFLSSRDLTD